MSVVVVCVNNVAFMNYIHIAWRKEIDGGNRGIIACICIFLLEEGCGRNYMSIAKGGRVREN